MNVYERCQLLLGGKKIRRMQWRSIEQHDDHILIDRDLMLFPDGAFSFLPNVDLSNWSVNTSCFLHTLGLPGAVTTSVYKKRMKVWIVKGREFMLCRELHCGPDGIPTNSKEITQVAVDKTKLKKVREAEAALGQRVWTYIRTAGEPSLGWQEYRGVVRASPQAVASAIRSMNITTDEFRQLMAAFRSYPYGSTLGAILGPNGAEIFKETWKGFMTKHRPYTYEEFNAYIRTRNETQ